mgnify:CR=1 FL=1
MAMEKLKDWTGQQIPVIRYKGVFDWPGLYRLCRLWIEENRYRYYEKRYKHKGDEVEVDMIGLRKVDAMHRYNIGVHFHIWHLREIEVPKGTKTVKLNQANVQVWIVPQVDIDYTERFADSKLARRIFKWWLEIRKRDINVNYVEALSKELMELHTKIKTFLNMSSDVNYWT